MKIKWLIVLLLSIPLYAIQDNDADGVPDRLDQCPDTPFFAIVDKRGCMTERLYFPQERESGSLDTVFVYEYNFNEEDVSYGIQHSLSMKLSYILHDWIYAIQVGRFIESDITEGMRDTIVTVKKRFRPIENWKTLIGASLRLPTYDFTGNRTDLSLHLSTIYYPKSAWSVFGGIRYTFIGDKTVGEPLQNTYGVYVGSGYFFTKSLYINASYNYLTSKYKTNHAIQTLSTTLFYEWNKRWYTSVSYAHQINDEDLHHTFTFNIGFRIW